MINSNKKNSVENATEIEPNQVSTEKNSILFKIVEITVIVLLTLTVLFLIVFALYKSTIDVSSSNEDKFDYVLVENSINNEYKLKDFIDYSYEEDPNTLFIEFPNDYFYKCIANINKINSELKNSYNTKINRIGLLSNISKKNVLDFYLDTTYNDLLNIYISGCLRYELKDNNVLIYVDSINIGDGFPKFLSDLLLDIHDGDLIYEYNANDYDYLSDNSLKLDYISNITKSHKSFKFNYDYMSNLENVVRRIFKDKSDIAFNTIKPVMPIVMEIIFGENSEVYSSLIEELFPTIYEYIEDIKKVSN